MKLTKRDIGLLLGAFGVLIAVAVYSLVYTPYSEKTASLKSELATLKEQEARYQELAANQQFYKDEIERLNQENKALFDGFPADIQPETEIMYVVELEENVDIEVPSVNYGTATSLTGASETTEEGEVVSSGMMDAYVVPMNLSYSASYQGLKDTITYTSNHQNRMVVDTVSAAYDSTTGQVTGSMTFNMYYVTGTDKVYEEPYVPHVQTGISNIFGTIEYSDDTAVTEETTDDTTAETSEEATNE